MSVRPIRIAVIGCGFYAQNHLHAWKDLAASGAELVAVCDADRSKAEKAAREFDAEPFDDIETMIYTAKPDAVDIVTRMGSHREICGLIAEAGLAAVVQKPLAPTWEECVTIAEKARQHGVFLAVHENFRFQTPMQRVKAVIASGAIGAPTWARLSFRTGFDVYRTQPYFLTEERLVILDVGIHVLDLARVFLGEVARISCETQKRNPEVRAEDTATMMLRHESGAVSLVECTYEAKRIPDAFPETLIEIEGDAGSLIVSAGEKMRVTSQGLSWEEGIGAPLRSWTARPWHASQEGAYQACRHMLGALQAGVQADTDIADNLRTYALVEAAYKAAETGASVIPAKWPG